MGTGGYRAQAGGPLFAATTAPATATAEGTVGDLIRFVSLASVPSFQNLTTFASDRERHIFMRHQTGRYCFIPKLLGMPSKGA
jgi:hypothetical protein